MQQIYGDNPHIISKKRPRTPKNVPSRGGCRRGSGFLIFLLLVSLAVFGFTLYRVLSSRSAARIAASDWFYVSLYEVTSKPEADAKAQAVRESGGSGFVLQSSTFHVTAAVFSTRDAADKVAAKQGSASVVCLSVDEIKLDFKPTAEQAKPFNAYKSVYRTLFPAVNAYDRGELTDSAFMYEFTKAVDALTVTLNSLSGLEYPYAVSAALSTHISESIGLLRAAFTDQSNYSATARYALCAVVSSRARLSKTLNA